MLERANQCEHLRAIKPKRKASELILQEGVFSSLDRLLAERRYDKDLAGHGLSPRHKLLFWGPPGNGKTATAEAIASALRVPYFVADCSHIVDQYLGASEKNLREMFDALTQPCVALLDECDTLLTDRNMGSSSCQQAYVSIVNYFIQRMDTLPSCVTFIAATNRRDVLDPAVLRRFHTALEFTGPTAKTLKLHKRQLLAKWPILETVPEEVIRDMIARSHADLERQMEDLARSAVIADRQRKGGKKPT